MDFMLDQINNQNSNKQETALNTLPKTLKKKYNKINMINV